MQFLTKIGSYQRPSSLGRTGNQFGDQEFYFVWWWWCLTSYLGAGGVEDCDVEYGGEACGLGDGGGVGFDGGKDGG